VRAARSVILAAVTSAACSTPQHTTRHHTPPHPSQPYPCTVHTNTKQNRNVRRTEGSRAHWACHSCLVVLKAVEAGRSTKTALHPALQSTIGTRKKLGARWHRGAPVPLVSTVSPRRRRGTPYWSQGYPPGLRTSARADSICRFASTSASSCPVCRPCTQHAAHEKHAHTHSHTRDGGIGASDPAGGGGAACEVCVGARGAWVHARVGGGESGLG
jgi:hypothetical protein